MVAGHLCLLGAAGALGSADLEAVLEASGHGGERSHAAGTGGLSALGLLGPVVCFTSLSASCSGPPALFAGSVAGRVAVRVRVDASVHVHFLVLAAGKPQEAQVCFWMCRDRRPVYSQKGTVSPLSFLHAIVLPHSVVPCSSNCSTEISGGYALLTTATAQSVRLVVTLSERAGSLRCSSLSVSLSSEGIEIVGHGERTHFVGLSGAGKVSIE